MAKITDTMVGQLIQAIGGRDNITHCGHCMTRLRLSLADSLHADRDTIKRIAGVMGSSRATTSSRSCWGRARPRPPAS